MQSALFTQLIVPMAKVPRQVLRLLKIHLNKLNDPSLDLPQRQRTGDAILCMLGDMKTSFNDALKSTEPLPLPHVTPPAEIFASLQMIPDVARCDMLKSYGKLILNECLFQALMELPMDTKKEWLLMLNEKNSN
ncbi:hypothetical protein PAHAL_5G426000 [Panicum hallii]|jgi:hypothetical protein|uniref:Uncharacterized protein n=1 Tax=Panicum hallii TaxID=206008 RepID=A0A2T8IN12_9POAL|nr:hypothetical protein PAHAL_5G426000 [Panicum hallii]